MDEDDVLPQKTSNPLVTRSRLDSCREPDRTGYISPTLPNSIMDQAYLEGQVVIHEEQGKMGGAGRGKESEGGSLCLSKLKTNDAF